MVRHDRRSMAATNWLNAIRTKAPEMPKSKTHIRVQRHTLFSVIGIICVLQVQHAAFALDAAAIASYADNGSMAVGRSAHEPKFGERLLPLRKKNVNNLSVARPEAVPSTTANDKHVNSLLNKSDYVVSHENSAKVHNNIIEKSEENDSFTEVVTTLDSDYETFAGKPKSRQAKQLNRREDSNMADVIEQPLVSLASSNMSKADRLVVMSTEFFLVPTSSSTTTTRATPRAGPKSRGVPAYIHPPPPSPRSVLIVAPKTTAIVNSTSTPPTIVPIQTPFTGLRKEPWVVPVLVLASLTMLMMGAFEIFVLFKAWRTSPSRRHLFLGQMLLLGLFACAGLGAVITAQPSLLSCGAIRFGVGVAYALVFAALLVKCVFLISLNGGVYLPAPYQGLLLLFAVLIQVAIGAQWLLTQPPEIYTLSVPVIGSGLLASTVASSLHAPSGATSAASTFAALFRPAAQSAGADLYTRITAAGTVILPLCKTQFSEFLFSLIYIIFLIVFVAVLAIKSRGIRDNYREATYIGLAIGGAIPIWLGWMLCGLAVAERHKDACIAFGLVATSATVFLVMFMPKGRQLAAMGKEGLYVEDREEQFSSLSRAGSGYSPSFFHFKPLKYGVMSGGIQNSTSNAGNGVSAKHCSNAINGGGEYCSDIIIY
ncbi:uncharacterized protein LOC119683783 [Teleopsis dalmanni]|uniref:uncharacterized protein LOC119683783 n=1 Tax=Teleopsis dalmanni TaxID=139649 RepID=UPI0018CD27AA|nr:uncharacterized protein LOC119683783 [Teleopsis dalmanni]